MISIEKLSYAAEISSALAGQMVELLTLREAVRKAEQAASPRPNGKRQADGVPTPASPPRSPRVEIAA
jgi:hypothetical protein